MAAMGTAIDTARDQAPRTTLKAASRRHARVVELLARRDVGCERLMSVPGIGPIISSAMVAAIGLVTRSRKAATWVMCGRRLIDKSFFTLMQHWSGAVMCPAC